MRRLYEAKISRSRHRASIRNVLFATGTIGNKRKILKFLQMSVTLGVNRVISSVTLSA